MLSIRYLSLYLSAFLAMNLLALEEGDLKDDKGEIVVHYAIETPKVMAPPETTDSGYSSVFTNTAARRRMKPTMSSIR